MIPYRVESIMAMGTLTVQLSERMIRSLHERAQQLGVPLEVLLQAGIYDLLQMPDEHLRRAVEMVLTKNRELYERLR